jgi:hypothetical protein
VCPTPQNPVPVSEMDAWLTCKPVDLSKSPGSERCQVYTVQQGDYGEKIAADFGVSVAELAAINPNVSTAAWRAPCCCCLWLPALPTRGRQRYCAR